jgi:addiction module HigA family antidote
MVKFGLEVHPGEILEEQMEEVGLSANALATHLGVPANRISAIINGSRGVTADTALRLGQFFGQTPEFWMNLQRTYDLVVAERAIQDELKAVRPLAAAATRGALSILPSRGALLSTRAHHSERRSTTPRSKAGGTHGKNIFVQPHVKGWEVKKAGAQRASAIAGTKAEAVKIGRDAARKEHSELVIKGKDGAIQQESSHGRDPRKSKG